VFPRGNYGFSHPEFVFGARYNLPGFNNLHLKLTEIMLRSSWTVEYSPIGGRKSPFRGGTKPPPWGGELFLKGGNDR